LQRRFAVEAGDLQPGLEIVLSSFTKLAIFRLVVQRGVRRDHDEIFARRAVLAHRCV
jgi:hypothetical protein